LEIGQRPVQTRRFSPGERAKSADGKRDFQRFSALFCNFEFSASRKQKQKIRAANQKIEFDAFHFSAFRLVKTV